MKRLILAFLLFCLSAPVLALEGLYYVGEYEGDDFDTAMEFSQGSVQFSRLTHKANTIRLNVVEAEDKHFTIAVGEKTIHLFETSPETFLMKIEGDDDLMLGLKKSPSSCSFGKLEDPQSRRDYYDHRGPFPHRNGRSGAGRRGRESLQ